MHRCGTSFLARALNLYGVFLGDFGTFQHQDWNYHWDNPRGSWENKKLLDLSEETLEINGGSWDNIPNKITINKKIGDQISKEIKKISDNSILAAGFKAPQVTVCFDSWLKYFPKNFIVIGIIRNPLKAAESLKTRNNFDYKKSLHLWKIYNQKLYETLQKYEGFLLDFDWPKQKLLEEIELISNKLGLAKNIDISSWYTEDLFRSDKTFKSDYIIPEEIQSLYSKLKDRSNNNKRVHIKTITHTKDELKITVNNLLNDIQKQSQLFTSLRNDQINNPISILMNLYNSRNDLQQSFPEAQNGNLTSLVSWAVEVIKRSKPGDERNTKELLLKFSEWYNNYLLNEQEESSKIKDQLTTLDQEKQQFKDDIFTLEQEKQQFKDNIVTLEQEKQQFKDNIVTLEQEKQQFKDNIVTLEQEKQIHKDEITHKHQEISKLYQEISNRNVEYSNLSKIYFDLKNEISNRNVEYSKLEKDNLDLKNELLSHQQALNDIKLGTGFKIIRFYATKIDKIKQVKTIFVASREVIQKYGFRTFLHQAKTKIKDREFTIRTDDPQLSPSSFKNNKSLPKQSLVNEPSVIFSLTPPKKIPMTLKNTFYRQQQGTNYSTISDEQIYQNNYNVSVVIPTNSDENSLNYLFSKINSQKGMKDLEIILINSGTYNLNSLQKISNVKLINIPPEEFNHGTTRNLGASKARGDFIIFQSDDAMPSDNNLYYNLCTELFEHPDCGSVSARQIPKTDADLMFKSSITNHYKFLKHYHTKVEPNSFDNLNVDQKRSVAQIDDVCACYKKNVFSKYQYTDLGYGEDLEMGIKLVKDGYYNSNFGRASVIHSHSRPAYYWLKRAFTETRICNPLLGIKTPSFKLQYKIDTEQELLGSLWTIYNSIGLIIDYLKKSELTNIHQTFARIYQETPILFFSKEKAKSSDASIDKLFEMIFKNLIMPQSSKNLLLENYLGRLYTIENFIEGSYPSLINIQDDLFDTLYKIFGMFMGDILNAFMMYSKENELEIKQLTNIEKTLIGGV